MLGAGRPKGIVLPRMKTKNELIVADAEKKTELLENAIENTIITRESIRDLEERKRLQNRGKFDDFLLKKAARIDRLQEEATDKIINNYGPLVDWTSPDDIRLYVTAVALLSQEMNETFHNDEKAKRALREVDVDKFGNVVNVGIKNEVSENGNAPILLSVDSKILDTENDT